MNKDSGVPLRLLRVDGGMTENNLLLQLQADLLGINVGKTLLLLLRLPPYANGCLRVPMAALLSLRLLQLQSDPHS